MRSIAYYRIPHADHYTRVESDESPLILTSYSEVGINVGYVFAPYSISSEEPLLLIKPDRVTDIPLDYTATPQPSRSYQKQEDQAQYEQEFRKCHDAVAQGQFQKLVLSRTCELVGSERDPEECFLEACRRYPRQMVQLVSTPQGGTWLIASPEILIEGTHPLYHTVALAGTMKYQPEGAEWSEKNRLEQHLVEQYIGECIERFVDVAEPIEQRLRKEGPREARAGELVHLCTDFYFNIGRSHTLGEILQELHPTPAICGIPTQQAHAFIMNTEAKPRRYYSGFAGPVGIHGETHLYVSLRCAEKIPCGWRLHAGGGIMPASVCEEEWHETEEKMKTISHVL